jgi:hypothetical protein
MRPARSVCLLLAGVLLVALVALTGGCGSSNGTVRSDPKAATARVTRYGKGYRYDSNGWIYVHIEGQPYERGFQHGRLVARELAQVKKTLQHIMLNETGHDLAFFVKAAEVLYTKSQDDEFLTEIKGIAAGARSAGTNISWQEVLEWNANMELQGYWYPGIQSGKYADGTDNTHCSAFVSTGSYTAGGKVVMAHNNWDHYITGQYANEILDIKPASGHRMIMQSFPGYIASMTDFFVTDAGIMGTETTIGGFTSYDPKKNAEFYRMRRATQYANNLDEWVGMMLQDNNGGYANSWLLADTNTKEIMRFELGLEYASVKRTTDGYYIGFNCAIDPKIRNLECGGDPTYYDVRTPMGARRVRLTQLMNENRGRMDTEIAKSVLSDHYDVYLNEDDNPCSRTIEGHYELDDFQYWQARRPYSPQGALDGKVMDSDTAKDMGFAARWGSSSGMAFDAQAFFNAHPQWDDQRGYVKDRPTQPWTQFTSKEL